MTDDDQDDNAPRDRVITNSERIAMVGIEHDLPQRVAKLEDRQDEQRLDIASLLASRRSWRWTAGIGLPVLLTSIVVVMLWAIDRVSTTSERAGETKAKIDAQDNLIKLLQQDVVQLRQHAGLNGHPTSDVWALPDKLSLITPKDPHVLVSYP